MLVGKENAQFSCESCTVSVVCGRGAGLPKWFSRRSRAEVCDSHEIVGGSHQVGMHLYPRAAAIARAAQTSNRLHPAEGLLDLLADPLANGITAMAHGASIKRRAAWARLILGYVRRDSECAATRDEVTGVVAAVAGHRDAAVAGQVLIKHHDRGAPLRVAVGGLDPEGDQDGVAVLHQSVGRVTQLGLFARALLGQPGLRVGGRLMRRVGAALTTKVHRWIARIVWRLMRFRILAPEALERSPGLDQRSIDG